MSGTTDIQSLADRVRNVLPPSHASEKPMFGGITFLVNGNMLCCVSRHGLMVRVGKEAEAEALARPHARPCLGAGRPMVGFILVEPKGIDREADLASWVAMARRYVESLPIKNKKPKRRRAS